MATVRTGHSVSLDIARAQTGGSTGRSMRDGIYYLFDRHGLHAAMQYRMASFSLNDYHN